MQGFSHCSKMKQSNTILFHKIFPQPGAKRTPGTKKTTLKEDKFPEFHLHDASPQNTLTINYISLKEFVPWRDKSLSFFFFLWSLSLVFMLLSLKQTLNTSDHGKKYKELEVGKTALLFFCEWTFRSS